MHKKILLSLFLTFSLALSAGNEIVVDTLYLLQTDMAARTEGTRLEDDINGGFCALIKVETTQRNFMFDVGSAGIRKQEEQNSLHPAEIWLYVPANIRKMTIQHELLGVLRDYRIPVSIKAGCTYVMKLSTGQVHQYVDHKMEEKYLAFRVSPTGAIVEVEGVDWPTGESACRVRMGTYKYRVSAPDYHDEAGIVRVEDDGSTKTWVDVTLKPAFGWILFTGEEYAKGAKIYVDDRYVGTVPMKTDAVPSGSHKIKVVKSMYSALERTVLVTDEQTLTVKADLASNFATITLKTKDGAEIWVDGEKKGVGSWTGNLSEGYYLMETRAPHHRNHSSKQHIALVQNGQTIELPAPFPIYGTLDVRSTPMGANIILDGKKIDDTPAMIGKVLEGTHTIEIIKEGYSSYKKQITISENQTTSVSCTLESGRMVTLKANTSVLWTVDGKAISGEKVQLSYGKHTLEGVASGYIPLRTTFEVTSKTDVLTYTMYSKADIKFNAGENISNVTCFHNGNAFVVDYSLSRANGNVTLSGVPSRATIGGDISRRLPSGTHRFYISGVGSTCSARIDAASPYNRYASKYSHSIETSLLVSGGQSLQWSDMRNYGFMFMQLYDAHGWYLKARSSFMFPDASKTAEVYQGKLYNTGDYSSNAVTTYFPTGNRKISSHTISVGYAIDFLRLRLEGNRFNKFGLYTGLGYGYVARYHEVYAEKGNTTWVKELANSGNVPNGGLVFDLGFFFSVYGFTISAGYNSINFVTDNQVEVGVGWTF